MGFWSKRRRRKMTQRYEIAAKDQFDSATPTGWQVLDGFFARMQKWSAGGGVWERYTDSQLGALYRNTAIIYACVRKIAVTMAEAPMKIGFEDRAGVWKDTPDHPLMAVLARPNDIMGTHEFVQYFTQALMLTGMSFIWEKRASRGNPLELWPLPSGWVTIVPSRAGGGRVIEKFQVYQEGRQDQDVVVEDMTMLRLPDPTTLIRGAGPTIAAARDIQIDQERENYLIEMLVNLKVPGLVVKSPKTMVPKQKEALRARIRDMIGRGRRGNEFLLEGGMELELTNPLKDMDWPGVSGLSETRICASYGVPPIVVHLRSGLERSTYSNYEWALRAFYTGTMAPLYVVVADALTRGLLQSEGDDKHKIYFDTSEIIYLQEDLLKQTERTVKEFQGGLITRNEARGRLGEDPLAPQHGDIIVISGTLTEIPISDAARKAQESSTDSGDGDDQVSETDEDSENAAPESPDSDEDDAVDGASKAAIRRWLRIKGKDLTTNALKRNIIADGWLSKVEKAMANLFTKQAREAAEAVRETGVFDVGAVIERWTKEIEDVNRGVVVPMVTDGYNLAKADLGDKSALQALIRSKQEGVLIGAEEEFLLERIHSDVAGYLERTSRSEARTWADTIERVIQNAAQEGLTPNQMATEIVSQGVTYSLPNAKRIARTTTIWSYNEGAQIAYASEGITQKQWIVTLDDNTCEFCEPMDEKIVAMDNAFVAGGSIVAGSQGGALNVSDEIGDVEHPPLHPNCRCVLVPAV